MASTFKEAFAAYRFSNNKLNGLYWWDGTLTDVKLLRTIIEPLEVNFSSGFAATSILSSSIEKLTCEFTSAVPTTNLVGSLEKLTTSFISILPSVDLVSSLENLTFLSYAGSHMSCILQELIIPSGVTGMAINAVLSPLTVSMRSGLVEHFEASLRPIDVTFYGESTSHNIDLKLKELESSFSTGAGLALTLEQLTSLISGSNGPVASLQAVTKFLDLEFLSGTHLRAKLEDLTATLSGRNKNFVHLNATTEKITLNFLGAASIHAALDIVLRSASFTARGTSYARSTDDISVELSLLKTALSGHFSGYNTLDLKLVELMVSVVGIVEIKARLSLFLEPLEANMLSLNSSISCTPFATLTHGGR